MNRLMPPRDNLLVAEPVLAYIRYERHAAHGAPASYSLRLQPARSAPHLAIASGLRSQSLADPSRTNDSLLTPEPLSAIQPSGPHDEQNRAHPYSSALHSPSPPDRSSAAQ